MKTDLNKIKTLKPIFPTVNIIWEHNQGILTKKKILRFIRIFINLHCEFKTVVYFKFILFISWIWFTNWLLPDIDRSILKFLPKK